MTTDVQIVFDSKGGIDRVYGMDADAVMAVGGFSFFVSENTLGGRNPVDSLENENSLWVTVGEQGGTATVSSNVAQPLNDETGAVVPIMERFMAARAIASKRENAAQ